MNLHFERGDRDCSMIVSPVHINLITIHYFSCIRRARCLCHAYPFITDGYFQTYSSFDFIFAANYGRFSISTLKRKESNKLLCLYSFHQWCSIIWIGWSMILEFCEPLFLELPVEMTISFCCGMLSVSGWIMIQFITLHIAPFQFIAGIRSSA